MIDASTVLRVLLQLPVCWADRDEPPAEHAARFEVIATAIARAAEPTRNPVDTAAMLIALGYRESRLCRAVHAGHRRGGVGEGLWQLEPGSRRVRPFSGLSLEATEHAAHQATWLITHSYSCGARPAQRFTLLAFGRCAPGSWPTQRERVQTYWWAVRELSEVPNV